VRPLSAADPTAAARLPDPLNRRVEHVLAENARVDAAVAAPNAGDVAAVGPLLDASHASLRDLYDASVTAVEGARERLLAAGARMMGGGFGGAVLGLFPPGAQPPADAVEVEPGWPARVVS
jgi:galactokinase